MARHTRWVLSSGKVFLGWKLKELVDDGFRSHYAGSAGKAAKRQTVQEIKRLGYKVRFLDPAYPEAVHSFVLQKRGRFGLSIGMTYRGMAASAPSARESAIGSGRSLAQGISY